MEGIQALLGEGEEVVSSFAESTLFTVSKEEQVVVGLTGLPDLAICS